MNSANKAIKLKNISSVKLFLPVPLTGAIQLLVLLLQFCVF